MHELILSRGYCFLLTGELSATNIAVSCFTAQSVATMPRAKFIGTEKPAATVFSGKVRFFLSVKTGICLSSGISLQPLRIDLK